MIPIGMVNSLSWSLDDGANSRAARDVLETLQRVTSCEISLHEGCVVHAIVSSLRKASRDSTTWAATMVVSSRSILIVSACDRVNVRPFMALGMLRG
jgi:hypothetical protein